MAMSELSPMIEMIVVAILIIICKNKLAEKFKAEVVFNFITSRPPNVTVFKEKLIHFSIQHPEENFAFSTFLMEYEKLKIMSKDNKTSTQTTKHHPLMEGV
ncbi:CLUMA_CG019214, isoform A [Clunio marinus]|uniref:CLUMA_CG019214, isoform A n=1 Tax=Clunio marinus TaxID=568069 RepID=A0A1J1J451_9DIPT|nr:CLUMA_CG019214, isoform A [Clunio marinus]